MADLVILTEFHDVPGAGDMGSFPLFLVRGCHVPDNVAQNYVKLADGSGGGRYYYGEEAEAIRLSKNALLVKYQIEWSTIE